MTQRIDRRSHRPRQAGRARPAARRGPPPAPPGLRRSAPGGQPRASSPAPRTARASPRATTTPSPLGVRVLAGDPQRGSRLGRRSRWARPISTRCPACCARRLSAPIAARSSTREHEGRRRRSKFGALGDALADTRLHPIAVRAGHGGRRSTRSIRARVPLDDMVRLHHRRLAPGGRGRSRASSYNYVSTLTQLGRELFASTEGALIDQAFALTQGMALRRGRGSAQISQEIVRRARPPARVGDPHRAA